MLLSRAGGAQGQPYWPIEADLDLHVRCSNFNMRKAEFP